MKALNSVGRKIPDRPTNIFLNKLQLQKKYIGYFACLLILILTANIDEPRYQPQIKTGGLQGKYSQQRSLVLSDHSLLGEKNTVDQLVDENNIFEHTVDQMIEKNDSPLMVASARGSLPKSKFIISNIRNTRKRYHSPNHIQPHLSAFTELDENLTDDSASSGVRWKRMALIQLASLGIGYYGFQRSNNLFGGISQPFKIGNDFKKDRTLGFDELLHLQGGYRITQSISGLYRWAGVSAKAADWIGAGTAAFAMTTLEYIDGRRPNDEASYSDFAANLLGVGFGLLKLRTTILQDFDLRFSYLSPLDPFRHNTVLNYNRMTHWLTYDLERTLRIPLYLALGYTVRNARRPKAHPEFYFGVGFSPVEIIERFSAPVAKPFEFLRFYHFGSRTQI